MHFSFPGLLPPTSTVPMRHHEVLLGLPRFLCPDSEKRHFLSFLSSFSFFQMPARACLCCLSYFGLCLQNLKLSSLPCGQPPSLAQTMWLSLSLLRSHLCICNKAHHKTRTLPENLVLWIYKNLKATGLGELWKPSVFVLEHKLPQKDSFFSKRPWYLHIIRIKLHGDAC